MSAAASLSSLSSLLRSVSAGAAPHAREVAELDESLRDLTERKRLLVQAKAIRELAGPALGGGAGRPSGQAPEAAGLPLASLPPVVRALSSLSQLLASFPPDHPPLLALLPPALLPSLAKAREKASQALLEHLREAAASEDLRAVSQAVPLLGELGLAQPALKLYLSFSLAELRAATGKADGGAPKPVRLADLANRASTHLRHHLPMASESLGPDGAKGLLQDLDASTEEAALLVRYAASYERFAKHCVSEIEKTRPPDADPDAESRKPILPPQTKLSAATAELSALYASSESALLLSSLLSALSLPPSLSPPDPSSPHAVSSSLVEDLFFVARRAALRAVATTHTTPICGVLNHAANALELAVAKVLGGKRAAAAAAALLEPGEDGGGGEGAAAGGWGRRSRAGSVFNDHGAAMRYAGAVADGVGRELEGVFGGELDEQLKAAVSSFAGLQHALQAAHPLHRLLAGLKPTVKTVVENASKLCDYAADDAESGTEGASWIAKIIAGLDEQVGGPVAPYLCAEVCGALWDGVGAEVARRVEMAVRRKKFSEVGALKFDADVRALVAYFRRVGLAGEGEGGWGGRGGGEEGLERLRQIAKVLGVYDLGDVVNVVEGGGAGGLGWLLKKSEVRGYLSLKIGGQGEPGAPSFVKTDIDFVIDRLVL
ncbi:hypothetical protein TeGR_g6890 [Tetraparma gracilis]|uniref:Uncharacterized protein n=1 Tax=Tetraparma gracilis TaxID=2962635 RepID=A0ABQ6MU63_9STRA|nr:hypothetical protein TeGR_g6890 [Tetraparma gracilis]